MKILAGILALGMVGVVFLCWMLFGVHTPDLTPTKAAQIIADRPEFNKSLRMESVSRTVRGADSLNNCCYDASFTFTTTDSPAPIAANAEFRFWDGGWHLQNFVYGSPPDVVMVWIRSDVPVK